MDLNAIQNFINTVGFPIGVCCVLFGFLYKYIVPHLQESTKVNKECSQAILLMNERIKMLRQMLI